MWSAYAFWSLPLDEYGLEVVDALMRISGSHRYHTAT